MAKKQKINNNKKFAQSCVSRECKKNHGDKFSESVTTPHELDRDKNEVICMYCSKKTKLPK
jgi:uncharacterized Zn-finger protein